MLHKLISVCITIALSVVATQTIARSPIIIASGESIRAQVNAELLVQVLQRSGFKAKSFAVDAADAATALTSGQVHILPEVPLGEVQPRFGTRISAGSVIDLGFKQAAKSDPKYRKLAWSKTRRRWTNEFKLIKNMTVPEKDVLRLLEAVRNGQPVNDAVAGWVRTNQKRWGKWKSASKNWMKP